MAIAQSPAPVRNWWSSERPADLETVPDPPPREIFTPIISVDDHLLEPPGVFRPRVPARMRERAPEIVLDDDALPHWQFEGTRIPVELSTGMASFPRRFWRHAMATIRYEEFRRGTWDVHARLADMDGDGVWASLPFPSTIWGFAGRTFAQMTDPELGLACVRAYNDWLLEEWVGACPERFIACQVPWMLDAETTASMVRENADRGFRAISFSENPQRLGLPSLYSGYWDPVFAACEETDTVINLHVGSSSHVTRPSEESPSEVIVALFPLNGMMAATDWIFARIPLRFPALKIVLSEAGVSWVPMLLERLRRVERQAESSSVWTLADPTPAEVLLRNFWFTSLEDPSAFRQLDTIGVDKIMVETDYPHSDATWPDTQRGLRTQLADLPGDTVRALAYGTAAQLYRHPAPPPDFGTRTISERS